MSQRRQSAPASEAVTRRLRLLSQELAAVRVGLERDDEPADLGSTPDPSGLHDPQAVPDFDELEDTATNRTAASFWEPEQGPSGASGSGWTVAAPATHTRVRPNRASARRDGAAEVVAEVVAGGGGDAGVQREEPAPAIPVPGRHASRRSVLVRPGRPRITSAHLAVLAVVVGIGLVVAAWVVVRSGPAGEPVASAAPSGSEVVVAGLGTPGTAGAGTPGGESAVSPGSPAASGAGVGQVTVDVAGKVRDPGIVVLDSGSRVVDALKAAGGVRKGVDLTGLNQARLLVDGEQIVVGGTPVPGVAASAAPSGTPGGALVNINTSDQAALEELPGVGPVTAQAIIDWRTENGGFTSVDELLEVDGIGDATLADLAPYVTI